MQPILRTDLASRVRVRALQAPLLIRRLGWRVRWAPVPVAGLLAAAIVTQMKNAADGYDMLTAARVTILFLAIGVSQVLDDPAANVAAPSPTSFGFRRSLRITSGAAVVFLTWAASLAYVAGTPRALWGGTVDGLAFPVVRVSIELAALTLAALTLAVIAGRRAGEDRGGLAAAPGLLAVLLLLSRLPQRWAMLTAPGSERWTDSSRDWLLAAAGLCVLLALLSMDPARRKLRARLTR